VKPYFKSEDRNFTLLHGDSFELLSQFEYKFDMVFADPPYFLSNNGLTVKNGKVTSVNKAGWDASPGVQEINEFNLKWLALVRDKMHDNATIWISGTMHNIFSIGLVLAALKFKILNVITWQKTNPPPSWAKRSFTHSTEQIIWARKSEKAPHVYNYNLMEKINGGQQMKDVWTLPAIQKWEKSCGKHPTQKPLGVLTRTILASTKPNAWILDPFTGSSTTGIAANLLGRRFLGIDLEEEYLQLSRNRKTEIENENTQKQYIANMYGFQNKHELSQILKNEA
jgi:site-specific DNA-methyltransferase (adenine-specific)